jgi:hypothetical protein
MASSHHLWPLRGKVLAQFLGDPNRHKWGGFNVVWMRQQYIPRNLIGGGYFLSIFDCELEYFSC